MNTGIYLPEFDRNLKWVPVADASDKTKISEHILRNDLSVRKFGNKDYIRVSDLIDYLERN
jgi:hypothetical protein